MSGRRPALVYAERAAEAVRALNHTTRRPDGYAWPSDVYAVIGQLQVTAVRLPQALEQAGRWLQAANRAGQVGHDAGADPAAVLADALADLNEAIDTADRLSVLLDLVQQSTSHLTGVLTEDRTEDGAR